MENIKIKKGQIIIDKKMLITNCDLMHNALKNIDKLMIERESFERGKKIAKECNQINFSLHAIEHFLLNIPLNKLK